MADIKIVSAMVYYAREGRGNDEGKTKLKRVGRVEKKMGEKCSQAVISLQS